MKRLIYAGACILVAVILASCGSDGTSKPTNASREKDNEASANEKNDPLEGTWHTAFTCPEMVQALKRGGVPKSIPGTLQDVFRLNRRPSHKNPCAGVDGTVDHTLRFTGGHFALFTGEEISWRSSYELIDEDTFVTGPLNVFTVDFRVEDDKLFPKIVLFKKIVAPPKRAPYIAAWESAPWERES